MRKIIFAGMCMILLLTNLVYALSDNACYEKFSLFGINDDYEIEWRIESTWKELNAGVKIPENENATTVLIVYRNVLFYSLRLR
jgi:hypothetical protein